MRCDGIKSRSGLVTVFSPLQLLRFQNGVTGAQRRHMVKLLSWDSVNFRKYTKMLITKLSKAKHIWVLLIIEQNTSEHNFWVFGKNQLRRAQRVQKHCFDEIHSKVSDSGFAIKGVKLGLAVFESFLRSKTIWYC